ncbi:MAG: CPBP family glutamic-type intramembrane protease [Spirochaetales bacterium]|nr:CPBP family glutamic-type intramembrane protease [Spirochaetales bacterium]
MPRLAITNRWFFIPYAAVAVGVYFLHSAWVAVALYHGGILLYLVATGRTIEVRGLVLSRRILTVVSLSAFAVSGLLFFVMLPHVLLPGYIDERLASYGLSGRSFVVFVGYFSLVNPLLEELFWRLYPARTVNLLDDVLFAGYHPMVLALFMRPVFVVISFFALIALSRYWSYIKVSEGKHLYIIATHVLGDFSIILSVYIFATV